MLIIDRFEGNLVVCKDNDNNLVELSVEVLPEEITEGDILVSKDGAYYVDKDATEARRKMLNNKMNMLFNKNK